MASSSSIFAVLLACSLALASASCFSRCNFRFCDGRHVLHVGTPDKALTGPICRRDLHVGIINTGESTVRVGHRHVPISRFHPAGLTQKFSPSFFKTFTIRMTRRSGVGHEVPQGNQIDFLDHLCVKLPVTAYQVLSSGVVVDNINPRDDPHECIAFRVRV